MFQQIRRNLAARRRRRRDLALLTQLSDEQLDDIGLSRESLSRVTGLRTG